MSDKPTSSADLRRAFLEFFQARGHEIVPSSPLVPANDPTLLFTNAGMVQFKDVFLGRESRPYTRAVSTQRCVRAGGKHNDLENVGYTARHHTFFEMLGNFSFGDYFKREAIDYAWTFLTGTLGLAPEKLWVTVFEEDEEAADIWLKEIKVDPARFSRIGAKDNFWSMGETGPCGPCTEIFFDHGPDVVGGPPGTPEEDGDRYIEIWNLVFMQYDRAADGTLNPLPRPSVDTGMGLERLAAVMQHVHENYEIDLFQRLIRAAAALGDIKDLKHVSLKVIADHIRSSVFLITDGVLPANEGRGYVLRRIIRRAIRHGNKLGLRGGFFHQLVAPLVHEMGAAFPELRAAQAEAERVLRQEEERFAETLEQGLRLFEEAVAGLQGRVIPGEAVFRLYDTYGFPVDLTADIARERGLAIDMPGFERAMDGQRERARAASQFGAAATNIVFHGRTEFIGYELLQGRGRITGLFRDEQSVAVLGAGEEGIVFLDRTPFYAEGGGQVGDRGELRGESSCFAVRETRKQGEAHAHMGRLTVGELHVGMELTAQVDADARLATAYNHSATHLLHAALRRVLGAHVQQKGSLVSPDRLRFDFAHFEPLSAEQLREIEHLVNEQIRANHAVDVQNMAVDQALASGAVALFGEKYGDDVRVLRMGEFSMELCGGTHVRHTGDIGVLKITAEGGVAAGVRRIEGATGAGALAWIDQNQTRLERVAELVKGARDNADEKVMQLIERSKTLEKELAQIKGKLASAAGSDLAGRAQDIGGAKVLIAQLDGADVKTLRDTVDQLKSKLGSAVVLLAAVHGNKVSLIAGVTKDLTQRVSAGELVNVAAQHVGGKGGGRPDMAQAGGTLPEGIAAALEAALAWVRDRL